MATARELPSILPDVQAVVPLGLEITVHALDSSLESAWDDFVRGQAGGTPFHLTAWKRSIEDTFGFQPHYLTAMSEGRIRGVLPLFLVKNPVIRKALISSPFAVYGGALGDHPEAYTALRAAVETLGAKLGVQYVELRNWDPGQVLGFSLTNRYVTFTQVVNRSEEELLELIPRKTRAAVRKSLRSGLATRITNDPAAFEDLYARNLRRLGTPAFPAAHFHRLLENFRGQADIREVVWNGKVIAATLVLYFGDSILPYYGAADPEFNNLGPSNFMYFDLMRWGSQNGYRIFDFGRSKQGVGGSYDFKAHWGMTEQALPYEILLVKRKSLPHFSPANPKFAFFIRAWQKLPLKVTRWIGPRIIRMFP